MTHNKHTPGPWHVEDDTTVCIPGEIKRSFDMVHATGSAIADAQDYANARLIAAAPDMLEALNALDACRAAFQSGKRDAGTMGMISLAMDAARAAIAKATGCA